MNNGVLDGLVTDASSRFGISTEKSRQLVGTLTYLIFEEDRGGFHAFSNLFRHSGLGDVVQSWIGTGPNLGLSPGQVEQVLGTGLVGAIARKLGIGDSVASGVISGLLPGLVDELSRDGREPSRLPANLPDWIYSHADWTAGLAMHHWGSAAPQAQATASPVQHQPPPSPAPRGGVLPWLILIAALVAAILLFRGCSHEEDAPQAFSRAPASHQDLAASRPASTPAAHVPAGTPANPG